VERESEGRTNKRTRVIWLERLNAGVKTTPRKKIRRASKKKGRKSIKSKVMWKKQKGRERKNLWKNIRI